MDLLDMEKLLESAKIAEKIADGVVDDQAYNVIAQTVGSEALVESAQEIENTLKDAKHIKNEVNLESLESEVNNALGIKDKEKPVVEGDGSETEAITDANNTPAQPATGVTDVNKFQDAAPVSQKEFTDANTNKEHDASGAANKEVVEKEGVSTMKEKENFVEKQRKDALKEKQNDVDMLKPDDPIAKTEAIELNASKYTAFVESLKDDSNGQLIEAVLRAFDVCMEGASSTFKCPTCNSKVLSATKYCLKCKKKVDGGSDKPKDDKKDDKKEEKDDKK